MLKKILYADRLFLTHSFIMALSLDLTASSLRAFQVCASKGSILTAFELVTGPKQLMGTKGRTLRFLQPFCVYCDLAKLYMYLFNTGEVGKRPEYSSADPLYCPWISCKNFGVRMGMM